MTDLFQHYVLPALAFSFAVAGLSYLAVLVLQNLPTS